MIVESSTLCLPVPVGLHQYVKSWPTECEETFTLLTCACGASTNMLSLGQQSANNWLLCLPVPHSDLSALTVIIEANTFCLLVPVGLQQIDEVWANRV